MTLDRNHDYITEFDKLNSVALSTGDVFSVDTSPYKTIGKINSYRPPQGPCQSVPS